MTPTIPLTIASGFGAERGVEKWLDDNDVLQPATGTLDHPRRLLYNALTRTKDRCSIIIFGQGRMAKPRGD